MAKMNIAKAIVIDHPRIMNFLNDSFPYFKNVDENRHSFVFEILGRGIPIIEQMIDVVLEVDSDGNYKLKGWRDFDSNDYHQLYVFEPEIKYVVLTVWQPYATLIVEGIKEFETRPIKTNFTSDKNYRILIHAAKKWDRENTNLIWRPPFYDELINHDYIVDYNGEPTCKLHLGQIIGSIDVKSCHKITSVNKNEISYDNKTSLLSLTELNMGLYLPGRYFWKLDNPNRYSHPIPYKGQQGIRPFKGNIKKILTYESL